LGGEAFEGFACGEQFMGDFGVAVCAVELADDFAVVVQTEPSHALQDRGGGFWCGACAICVFDAQQEFAAAAAGVEPVEQGGTGAADVQVAGGRGGKAGDDLCGGHERGLTFR
jgi:hypothetical protein